MVSTSASKAFPGFSGVYVLEEPGNSRAFRGNISLSVDDAFAVTRAEKSIANVEVRWTMGGRLPEDIIRTTIAAPVLISDRVVELLRSGLFTGWDTYRIHLFGKEGVPIHGYQGLAVRGRCGPIDNRRSTVVDRIMPGGVFQWWRGIYFDPATWDGSDLFTPVGNVGWIFVKEAVKRAFEKAKVRNASFTPLDQVERMKFSEDLEGPHRR